MNDKLLKPYNPKETENRIYKIWEDGGFFNPDNLPRRHKNPFTIVLPPPNVTGTLHMGHALNATIQDILIRQKRMQGYKTLWIPGTDHAGIATQNVVEKDLKKQGISRHDLGKEKFIEKVWEWKEKYGNIILDQLKKIGSSCDWSRTRFTMDEKYSEAVKTAFLHYYEKGWIYQGERVISWCPRCQTSLSDLEIEYLEQKSKLYFIKYPIKQVHLEVSPPSGGETSKFVTVATTRPETMLGDTAVAVNPNDERHKKLIGKILILPIQNREIPIIADESVDKNFGAGAVKVTPAHSIADSEMGQRHNLPSLVVINQYGKMTAEAGKDFEGLSAKDAREKVAEKLQQLNLMEKTEDYPNRISICYRCNAAIEPRPSLQWFLKMDELAQKAIASVQKGEVKFNDKRWKKLYTDWLFNIKDWCVSRQIWWGHKIPINGVDDVMDTWFSSALWPFAALDWPIACAQNQKLNLSADRQDLKNKNYCVPQKRTDLEQFYPTQVISTARDIINLWVARMVFSGIELMNEKPFSNIIIHPTILAKDGRRMSKSLGTGVDPIVLIEKYGADATRFGLIYQMTGGQDIKFDESHLLAGKKFANKLWNITRFVLQQTLNLNLESQTCLPTGKISKINTENLSKENSEILEKLGQVLKSATENIENYNFGQALRALYDFIWHDFADKYIEHSKTKNTSETKETLLLILINIIKTLHPFMPFITEEIWGLIPENALRGKLPLIIEKWPKI